MALMVHLNVLDNDGAVGDGDGGKDSVAALNVNDGGILRTNRGAAIGGSGAGEGDSAEVGEGNKRVILLEVLDDPLGIVLAQVTVNTTGEGVGNRLASGNVVNGGSTGGLGGGVNSDLDHITSRDSEVKVIGIVGVPLVPGIKRSGAALDTEVNTGLQDSSVAGVTVNTDPGGGTVLLTAGATAGNTGSGNGELSSDGSVASTDEDGTSPVGAVLDLGGVREIDGLGGAGLEGRVALALSGGASGAASGTLLGQRSSKSAGDKGATKDCSRELHFEGWLFLKRTGLGLIFG